MKLRIVILVAISLILARQFATAQVRLTVELKPDRENPLIVRDQPTPQDLVIISIKNDTPTAITIPVTYSPDVVRLCASGSNNTHWPLVLYQRRNNGMGMASGREDNAKIEMIDLPPGQRRVILRANARDILLNPGDIYSLEPESEFLTDRWVWEWQAHPRPDFSPFEQRKGDRRSQFAVIWCELEQDGRLYRSIPLLIQADWRTGG